jgi:hypothetical protein
MMIATGDKEDRVDSEAATPETGAGAAEGEGTEAVMLRDAKSVLSAWKRPG